MKHAQKMILALVLALPAVALLLPTEDAKALGALSFHWECDPPNGVCDFEVTSSNHAKVQWTFGDGSGFGPTTNMTTSHDYNFSGSEHTYTVTLIGYTTVSSSSPDNVISCSVAAQGSSPGGNPGANGNCSG